MNLHDASINLVEALRNVAHLRARNAKLVEALEQIANHSDIMSDWPHTTEAMQAIARAAVAKAKA
jgi:hypothetical protein